MSPSSLAPFLVISAFLLIFGISKAEPQQQHVGQVLQHGTVLIKNDAKDMGTIEDEDSLKATRLVDWAAKP